MSKLYNRFKYGLLTTSITLLSFGANAQNNDTISGESYYSSNIVQKKS